MKKILLSFSFLAIVIFASGQCAIDYTYYPVSANYGLNPDSLPNGYVGQFYDEDMTFFLPLDTVQSGVTVTFEDFHITSISLPLGLTWECDNSSNGCHYDPGVSQYGCVKISGQALMPGYYDVEVNLVATHSLSSLVGTESISFSLPLNILPDTSTSSNAGFAMTNPSGCAPVTVSFSNNNTGMLSYYWDFGNGNTSTSAQPVDQIYNQPGEYVVEYFAVQTNATYFLESIEVVSGTCSDNFATGDVDLFYTVSTPAGVLSSVSSGNYQTQPFPLYITGFNPLQLTGQSVTVEVWDNDDFWPFTSTEDCGNITFNPIQQAGTFSTNGGGLSINYTIMEVPANMVASTDTIYVYGYPNSPVLAYDTLDNIIYTYSDSIAMQWYYYNSPIPAATDTFVNPVYSGLYSLLLVNEYGCTASSSPVSVIICDTSYQPMLDDNGSTAWMVDSALYSNLQWYSVSDGAISGANHSFFPANSSGEYYIVATDTFGCSYASASVYLSPFVSVESVIPFEFVKVGPNPVSDGMPLNIFVKNIDFKKAEFVLRDVYGREVIRKVFNSKISSYSFEVQEIIDLSIGVYYLDIIFDGNNTIRKIVKTSR